MNINKNLMSRNHTAKKRTKKDIQWIVVHYVGALGDAKANTDYYKSIDGGASADFWVGFAGDIWQGNDYWNYYSWHCGGGLQGSGGHQYYGICGNANSVGMEMCVRKRSAKTMNATDKDWYFEDATVTAAAELVAYLMKELDIDIDHVIRHYDVNGKICPNPFVYDTGKYSWDAFKKLCAEKAGAAIGGTQTSSFAGLSEKDAAAKLLEISKPIAQKYGLLPSVTAAQTILEAGYCKTELAQKANNVCGMKCELSGNTWPGSTWDGKDKVKILTAEQNKVGNVHYEYADFRKYPNIETSIADRCAYLLGAMNGSKLRYACIQDCRDYKSQIKLIKSGGYATDVNYVDKICNIIQRFDLDKYDNASSDILPVTPEPWYRVRKSWTDSKSQIGAYHDLEKAKTCVNENWQYNVYGEDGNCIYNGAQALVDRAVDWMIGIANDDTHGYINGKWGPEYSCLSLVEMGYINAGLSITKSNIDKMPANLIKAGFEDCTAEGNLKTGGGLAKGDILWMLDATGKHGHVECYIGDGKLVGARGDTDGKAGDSRGDEISIIAYQNMSWQKVFRLPGAYTGEEDVSSGGTGNATDTTYRVQAGAYKKKTLARDALKKVRAAGYPDAFIREEGNMYKIQAWAGSRAGAEKVVADLKAKGINTIIK